MRIVGLLLRDIAAAASGNPDLILAADREQSIVKSAALKSGGVRLIGPLLDAVEVVEETRLQLTRNVAEELTLQALSFRLDRLLAGV